MSCPKFVATSLSVRTAAHMAHLTTRSYAQHVALGEFYPALEDLADRFAEVYMGQVGEVPTYPALKPAADSPIPLLEEYLEDVKAEMAEDHDSEALKNILAEIEELTSRTLYKLRFLK